MSLSVEEWTAGMDAPQLRACMVRLDEDIIALRAQNAELQAALKLIARQTEPRPDMPDVAVGICSAVNKIALTVAP